MIFTKSKRYVFSYNISKKSLRFRIYKLTKSSVLAVVYFSEFEKNPISPKMLPLPTFFCLNILLKLYKKILYLIN